MVLFMNRFVAPVLLAVLLAAPVQTVRAQDTLLRGSLGGAAPQANVFAQDDLGADDAADDTGEADATRAGATALVTDAGEEAEPLAEAGRIRAVQPFAERLRAVSRRSATGGGGSLINDIYDGETQRDAPRGIRVGSFLLYPELFTGLGWTDNRSGDTSGTSGLLYRVAPTLRAQSDWSRHSLGVNFRGSFTGYPDSSVEADPSATLDALLRLDVSDRTEVDVSARYGLSLEDSGSAEATGGGRDIHELGGGLALRRSVGLIGAELRGEVDSTVYSGGNSTAANRERDNALFSATLRLDSNTGAGLQPFVEGSLFTRRYFERCTDLTLCADRDSKGYALRAGIAFDVGGKITGDIGAGWRSETLDDTRLARLEGLTVDGSLIWSPTRLTTVTATLATNLAPSTIAGTPGSLLYSGDLRLAHGFSDALSGEIGVGLSRRDYAGIRLIEDEASATAALTWALTSNVAVQGRYTFRRFSSTTPGAGYSENAIEGGLRFRH
ncbi:MAG: hypothetical protein CML67_01115 [Rhodobacteraceae bacterium]|nr:hypothetical protein [Paracoccaceae bacterium]